MSKRRLPVIVAATACAWLGLPQGTHKAAPVIHEDGVVAEEPAGLQRIELLAGEGLPGRRWVRAVRDLVEDRFDVDALPPEAPLTVWVAGDELVAFELVRPAQGLEPWDDPGGPLFA
ncbi:MAG: hypothetical protein IT382_09455, partial [Deltaproteobacteria bacterium]|nr:hypothetical protein [Deltaproteobacteria bacterium]